MTEVEYTDEFGAWWEALTEAEQESVAYSVGLLEAKGMSLGHPHSSKSGPLHRSKMTQIPLGIHPSPL